MSLFPLTITEYGIKLNKKPATSLPYHAKKEKNI